MKKVFTFIAFLAVSLCSMAQTQFYYEWSNGSYTKRDISVVDSITFDITTPYDRLSGAWKMEVVSDYDGPLTFDVTVLTDEEGGSAYEKYCIIQGLSNYNFMTARLDYFYDENTEEGHIEFPLPYVSVEGVNFGSFVGDIHLYGLNESNQMYSSATIKGVWNEDMSELTFEATPKMGMIIFVGGQAYGWWDRFVVAKMSRDAKYVGKRILMWRNGVCVTKRDISVVDSITFTIPETSPNEYKYVDLGLPSGTLWADRNVGADSPEAYGDYFAWGEIASKDYYDWSTYEWCQGSSSTLTKYNTDSSYGTVDNKTVLDLEDDAAYVSMGKDWRMPTETQMSELSNNCTWTWTTQNGTKGYRVTGPNGNSIFLPAAGYRLVSTDIAASNGCYWSASLFGSSPDRARGLGFYSSNHYTGGNDRCYGHTVRAVAR